MIFKHPYQAARCTGDGCNSRQRGGRRRGAATAEMAITLPLMLVVIFGTLEICQRLLLRQTAAVAAYETARLAARRGASVTQATARGQQLLEQRRISGAEVTIIPADINSIPTGGELRVQVYVPLANNSTVSYALPTTGGITVVSVMLRE